MRALVGVAWGGEATSAGARPLVGSARGGAAASGAPAAAAMSLSRLCRLLKPALLCGALAAPGLAGAMVSAGGGPAGRWAGARGRGELGRGTFGSGPGQAGPPFGASGLCRGGCGAWAPSAPGAPGRGPANGRRPVGWKPRVTRRAASLPLPRPVRPWAPGGGVTDWRPGPLATGPLFHRARPSVGTGAAGDGPAWAAQPPAARVAAGNGAGCQSGGGAELPRGGRLGLAGARGRAPDGRSRVSREQGRRDLGRPSSRPGRAAAAPIPGTRCARGPPTRRRSTAWRGDRPSFGFGVLSVVPCSAKGGRLRGGVLRFSLPRGLGFLGADPSGKPFLRGPRAGERARWQ